MQQHEQEILKVLADKSTRRWLRHALIAALLQSDPIDALHDAQLMARLLADRADAMLRDQMELGRLADRQ